MNDIVLFIREIGFPVFVAVYVLIRIEPLLKELQETMVVLTIVIAQTNNIDYTAACKLAGKKGANK